MLYITTSVRTNIIFAIISDIIEVISFIFMNYYFLKTEFTNPGRVPCDPCLASENKLTKRTIEYLYI